ncbi:MAG: hypothetical protein Q4G52_05700 [Clostridia bacterium]|nr:hypothetical protein [Clostridia bacterium]
MAVLIRKQYKNRIKREGAVKLRIQTFQAKTKNLRPKVSKGRSESPLAGRWGGAPSSRKPMILRKIAF